MRAEVAIFDMDADGDCGGGSTCWSCALAILADLFVHLPWERHFLHLNAILAIIGAPAVIGMLFLRRDIQRFV